MQYKLRLTCLSAAKLALEKYLSCNVQDMKR